MIQFAMFLLVNLYYLYRPTPRYALHHSLFLHSLTSLPLFLFSLFSLYYHGLASVQTKGTNNPHLFVRLLRIVGVRTRNAIAVYQSFLCLLKALLW